MYYFYIHNLTILLHLKHNLCNVDEYSRKINNNNCKIIILLLEIVLGKCYGILRNTGR